MNEQIPVTASNATTPPVTALQLDQVIEDFIQLPALPEVLMQLLNRLQNGNEQSCSTEEITRLLAYDQTLTAQTLRIANSSFYGLPRQVASLPEAITVLGLRSIQTLVVTTALHALFNQLHEALRTAGYDQRSFWQHSLGTAICASALAKHLGYNADHAYTAGLLHDIGYLVFAARFPLQYAQVRRHAQQTDCQPLEAERALLHFDHQDVGAALARRWCFPADILEGIAAHHAPEDQTARSLAGIVHLADIMAHSLNLDGQAEPWVPRLSTTIWHRYALDWSEFKQLLGAAEKHMQEANALFN